MYLPRGIVIPCIDDAGLHYIKVRRSSGEPRYQVLKGGKSWIYGANNFKGTWYGMMFESELDVLLAWQTGYKLGYCSMPAGQKLQPAWDVFLQEIEEFIFAFDNDEAGQKAADEICKLSPHFYKANPFPKGKDLTEFFQAGGDVFEWLYDQLYLLPRSNGTETNPE